MILFMVSECHILCMCVHWVTYQVLKDVWGKGFNKIGFIFAWDLQALQPNRSDRKATIIAKNINLSL